jgi:hypothetical protein
MYLTLTFAAKWYQTVERQSQGGREWVVSHLEHVWWVLFLLLDCAVTPQPPVRG